MTQYDGNPETLRRLSTADLKALHDERVAAGGVRGEVWTPAERAVLYGDTSPEYANRHKTFAADLVRRLEAGEKLSKYDTKRARALKRETWWRA